MLLMEQVEPEGEEYQMGQVGQMGTNGDRL